MKIVARKERDEALRVFDASLDLLLAALRGAS